MGVSFEMGDLGLGAPEPDDRRINGVCPALVISNTDILTEGRIQIQVAWLPGYFLWARVAVPMAGMMRGTFFIPQVGDEVLVAFAQGDVREAYVIGSLWSTTDRPPATTPIDPVTKRAIRTPLGNELVFDEKDQSITLRNILQHEVKVGPEGIELKTVGGLASIKLGIDGSVDIFASKSLSLTGMQVSIVAGTDAQVTASSLSLIGMSDCSIVGGKVSIN